MSRYRDTHRLLFYPIIVRRDWWEPIPGQWVCWLRLLVN